MKFYLNILLFSAFRLNKTFLIVTYIFLYAYGRLSWQYNTLKEIKNEIRENTNYIKKINRIQNYSNLFNETLRNVRHLLPITPELESEKQDVKENQSDENKNKDEELETNGHDLNTKTLNVMNGLSLVNTNAIIKMNKKILQYFLGTSNCNINIIKTLFDSNKLINVTKTLNNTLNNDWFFKGTSGLCKKNKKYNKISSANDLKNYFDDLECIYARGNAPTKTPSGIWHGKILKIFDTTIFNFVAAAIWTGKLILEEKCISADGKVFNIAYNFVNNKLAFPAVLYIDYLKNNTLDIGEFDNKEKHLIVDYTMNINKLCSLNESKNSNIKYISTNDLYPFNYIIDIVRCVGRTNDGGYILLGKSLLRDPYQFPNNGDSTIAFWSVVNYDHSAFSDPSICELNDLKYDFTFKHSSAIEKIYRLIMLDSLMTSQIETNIKFIDNLRNPL